MSKVLLCPREALAPGEKMKVANADVGDICVFNLNGTYYATADMCTHATASLAEGVRISPDIRMAIVGAPAYLEKRPSPKVPSDLTLHDCINMRFSIRGGVYAWELKKGKSNLQVRVDGPWTFNCIYQVVDAALAGFGLAYVPEELALPHIASGRLQPVLKDWCPTFPGVHIFYASRRQPSPALSLVVETLRYRR